MQGHFFNIYQTNPLVWLGSGKICTALNVEFISLAARLAPQWIKERGIIVRALNVGFIYLAVRLARQGIKQQGIIDMRVRANEPNEPTRLVHS